MLVARVGLEPTCPCGQRILNPSRLPIPPPRHFGAPLVACGDRIRSVKSEANSNVPLEETGRGGFNGGAKEETGDGNEQNRGLGP
jgi:hypothetical protein